MTPDVIKKVYVKYQQYMNTYKNDTIHIDIGDFDITMNSFEKGYQVTLVENKVTTTHPDQQTTSQKTEKDKYVFIDSNGDGSPDDVQHSSSSKTSTISGNQLKPAKLLSSETKTIIEKTWQGTMKVIDNIL